MVRLVVRVKNYNLGTKKACLKREHMSLYYQGLVESIVLLTEDNMFLEEYYGYGLQKFIESASLTDHGYLLAERHLAKD